MTAWIFSNYVTFMKYKTAELGNSIKFGWQDFVDEFKLNFIEGDRWEWLLDGFKNTLLITFLAGLIGIVLGVTIAIVRSTYDKTGADMKKRGGFGYRVLAFFNAICNSFCNRFFNGCLGGFFFHFALCVYFFYKFFRYRAEISIIISGRFFWVVMFGKAII